MRSDFDENIRKKKKDDTYQGVGGFMMEIVKVFILAFIIIVPIRVFLFQPFFVQGASMVPNFHDGEYLIINELGYKQTTVGTADAHFFTVKPFKTLERGDVIVFRYPKNHEQFFIKRTIGLPGEKVEIKNGQVRIYNADFPAGFLLDESDYIPGVKTDAGGELLVQLKEDEYFVMGDNRAASHDSRSWGPLNKSLVTGKVLLRAWPFSEAGVY